MHLPSKHNDLELAHSPSSTELFRNIGKFEEKNILQTIQELLQFSCLLLQKDCTPLKQTLSSGQKSV